MDLKSNGSEMPPSPILLMVIIARLLAEEFNPLKAHLLGYTLVRVCI